MKKMYLLGLVVLLTGCNGLKGIRSAFNQMSPYEHYVESLKKANLLDASMTKQWISAGEEVFVDSIFVNAPFSEAGFFEASNPEARSYRFRANDGQVLTVAGAAKTEQGARMFLDLFVYNGETWKRIAYADSTLSITHEFSSNEECVVRLQPELLANAWYSMQISLTPVLINPVYGATNKAIGSLYGASRDNGKRSHEGVDIFAPKGTPVVAPTHGYISRVGTSALGGKVVWMKDAKRQHSYYFAHLDSQMVKPGMRVRQGHVLGLVGNTGNARYTPAHLHFGIYQSGSKDPLYYIRKVEAAIATFPIDTGLHQKPLKTRARKTDVMSGPSQKVAVKHSLERNTYLTVIGQSFDWYRISLPDNTEGFVLKKNVEPLLQGTSATLDTTTVLLSAIHANAIPVEVLAEDSRVEILASFSGYDYVKTSEGKAGWMPRRSGS